MKGSFIVTGGAGFIGSNLVKALNDRGCNDIIVVDHVTHASKIHNLNRIRFREYFDKADFRKMILENKIPEVEGVFHLGACSSTTEFDESYLADNNFQYTRDLCEWSLQKGVRFVYASSAATYGDGSKGYSDNDSVTSTLEPLNPYGKSKQIFDLWALENGASRRIAGLKYFNVYGPWEDHKGDMRSLVKKSYEEVVLKGRIRLFKSYRAEYRDGEQERDFVYVEDAVAVTLFLFDHPEICGIFNCGTGKARTWIDLAKAIFKAAGKATNIEFIEMPENIRDKYQYHTQADMTKLLAAGYSKPFIDIEEGVRRYVQNYLAYRDTCETDTRMKEI